MFFSETRAYMALVRGATMALIMLGFMWSMYDQPRRNVAIVVGSIAVFVASLWLVRSQATVDDVSWMKVMIPHHSLGATTRDQRDEGVDH